MRRRERDNSGWTGLPRRPGLLLLPTGGDGMGVGVGVGDQRAPGADASTARST